jgi:hypothetical protein
MKEGLMRHAALALAAVFAVACSTAETNTTCTPSQVECVGTTLRTCNAAGTGWSETVCDVACVNNACQVCTPNTHRCEGQLALSCNPDGSGWGQQSCQSGCDSATGTCKTQACTPNQTKCSAGSLMTCKADGSAWDLQACEYGCDAATNTCKTQQCVAGTVTCNGSKLVTCTATGLQETVCEFGCDWQATPNACKAAACAVGDKRCNPTEAKQIQTCKPDRTGWNNGTLCPNTCVNGECVAPPNCVTGEQTCRPSVAFHKDEIDECTAGGTWQLKQTCTTGNCVDQGGTPKKYGCGTCWKDERRCADVGDTVEYCADPLTGWEAWYDCYTGDWCMYGSCATPLELPAGLTDNYRALAQAFVQCWYWYMDQGVTSDEMCYILDGTTATSSVGFDGMKSWVCDTATVADFDNTQADYDLARDLVGCGFWNNSEITWQWDPLPAGHSLEACMWYRPSNSSLFDDEDYLDYCTNFVQ